MTNPDRGGQPLDEAEVVAEKIARDHAKTSPGPINCNIRIKFQEPLRAYPRTCARCGLGPCPFFAQDGSPRLPAAPVQER